MGVSFIGGGLYFTADFIYYQQIMMQCCEATFCAKGYRELILQFAYSLLCRLNKIMTTSKHKAFIVYISI